ncbi:hypothetical protein BFJ68_g17978, partial [Fusarium oxysporum]
TGYYVSSWSGLVWTPRPDQTRPFRSLPLSEAAATATIPSLVVMVIDALDECDQEADIKLLINIFSQAKTVRPHLRVFLTSRPELPIRLGFSEVQGSYQDLVLHDIPARIVEHDIMVFLDDEFKKIRHDFNMIVGDERKLPPDWPGHPAVESLAQMAVPLFIFAATVCRFVGDRKRDSPPIQLRKVLDYESKGHVSQLDRTYGPVLRSLITDISEDDKKQIIKDFKMIIGSIIILANPLSVWALSQLLEVDPEVVDNRLDTLHSVLSIPPTRKAPVRLLHLSFRDYLLANESEFRNREDSRLSAFVADAVRFLQAYFSAIAEAPLQIYSCLGFAPSKSVVRRTFEHAIPRWISTLPKVEENWDACLLTLEGHSSTVNSVVFSHDSKKVASASYDNTIRIWNAETGECERELKGHSNSVSSVVFSHDSKKVASASRDKTIRIWNAETGECERELKGHSNHVSSVVFSHDSKKVASASYDDTIRIWNAKTGECERELKGHSSSVNSVVFSHDSKKVASASYDDTIRIWNAETGECERELKGHSSSVSSVIFSHDSKKVASASCDKTIRIWNAETGECEDVVPLDGYAHVISFTPDGSGIVTNHGVFALTGGSQSRAGPVMPWQSSEVPILACTDSTWITAAGKDLLWLPPECRNGEVAVSGSTVVIGCQSGRVVLLGISMSSMEQ